MFDADPAGSCRSLIWHCDLTASGTVPFNHSIRLCKASSRSEESSSGLYLLRWRGASELGNNCKVNLCPHTLFHANLVKAYLWCGMSCNLP